MRPKSSPASKSQVGWLVAGGGRRNALVMMSKRRSVPASRASHAPCPLRVPFPIYASFHNPSVIESIHPPTLHTDVDLRTT
jgi:hypothetical protein